MTIRLGVAVLALLGAGACAQQGVGQSTTLAKTSWTVAKAWCPAGCSAAAEAVLKVQVGQRVELSQTQLSAPFVDACAGKVHLKLKSTPVSEIVADVNKAIAPGRRPLTAEDLGVAGSAVSGWALCRGSAGDMNMQRMLVLGADRVVLLSEEQSLIELR